jgi:NAD(P)-dependent dehydrogenase (short-subunit alcohol dehydrogenase family)
MHDRDQALADEAAAAAPGAAGVLVADFSKLSAIRGLADQVNRLGPLDAVIHNAGIGDKEPCRVETEDGLPHVFSINTLAAYVLTVLINRPARLVYLGSGLHHGASPNFDDLLWTDRTWNPETAYAESKLYCVTLALAVARRWPNVKSNALWPGWVPTRLGGPSAPDDINQAHLTQVWLATSDDPLAQSSGSYFFHKKYLDPNPAAREERVQDKLIEVCSRLSGIPFPA